MRILVEIDAAWRLLAVPSAFDMGLSDCRWIYRLGARTITVHAVAAGDEPAIQWQIAVEGQPCRFLVFGHLVIGERELDHAGRMEIDATGSEVTFRPDPASLFGQRYPDAVYHLVVSTPDTLEKIGGDELLYTDGCARGGGYVVLQTRATRAFCFAVVGSLRDATAAKLLAAKYARGADSSAMLAPAARYWEDLTRGLRITGQHADISALNTMFPWLAHNAMMHLTVPHGLEQYSGAAWGTRDVCQGPVEFFLALEHDAPVKDILRIVFAQQYEERGDWPQWFMLEPYSSIQDRHCHGDVIIWPLKALCDYLECTNDLAFLDEPVAWRGDADLARTQRSDPITAHVDKLLATLAERFIPGTRLLQYGDGDWNDSLQPVDPKLREWMVSSWSVALLFQQINRYAQVLRRAQRTDKAEALERLAEEMRADFHRYLIRDGTVAGYAVFDPRGDHPQLLLHPTDTTTGLSYSLLPMTRGIIAGLFTPEQAQHHLQLIREHLLFPDGVRLMDRPVRYRGGPQQLFRRAEFGGVFRTRDRPHVCPRPSRLRRGACRAWRGGRPLGGAAGGEPDRGHRSSRQRRAPPAQCLLQQQRRRLQRPLPGRDGVGRRQGWSHSRRRRLADLFQRPRPLRQRAASPSVRPAPVFWSAQHDTAAPDVAGEGDAGNGDQGML